MKVVFADTFYFLALLNPTDQYHARTVQYARQLKARFVTSDWVLLEVADALSRTSRTKVCLLIERLHTSPSWEVIEFTKTYFNDALSFYSQHSDKEWTLTDCASFVVMRERGITAALTGDHHFEQAGFLALLK